MIDAKEEFTPAEVQVFDDKYLPIMRQLSEAVAVRKTLEDKEKTLKAELEKAMDKYGIIKIDNDYVRISRIEESVTRTLDVKKFKETEPTYYGELFEDYPKVVKHKAYVKFEIKNKQQ